MKIRAALEFNGRLALVAAAVVVFGCANVAPTPGAMTLVDLSHSFDDETIYWPTEEGFVLETEHAGLTDGGYYYESHRFRGAEHGGTHIDAPVHFFETGWHTDEIPLERLVGTGVRIDVRASCSDDRDHRVSVDDLQAWEAQHGRIPAGAIVLLDTGFARYWPDRESYMGTDARGTEGVAQLHFPGLHPDAAQWLISQRAIHAVGIDTPSIDYGQSSDFATHVTLFASEVPAFENVAALDALPPTGFRVWALPMKIRGGSGGPLRIVAVIPAN